MRTVARGRWRWVGMAILGLPVGSCADPPPPAGSRPLAGELSAGVVARVGSSAVTGETVGRIAKAQEIDLRTARERAIYDALLSEGARNRGLRESPRVRAAVRGILAGELLQQQWRAARRDPLSDAEVALWQERRWIDVDRPAGFRTAQAVALAGAGDDPTVHEAARDLAERWRSALSPVTEIALREPAPEREPRDRFRTDPRRFRDPAADAFQAELSKIAPQGVATQLGVMPVVAADGRVIDHDFRPGSMFVPEYGQAAAELRHRGDVSPVVRSEHGYHVLMLLERLPERRLAAAELREELKTSIWLARADDLRQSLLERLRRQRGAHMVTNVDALLELVSVER